MLILACCPCPAPSLLLPLDPVLATALSLLTNNTPVAPAVCKYCKVLI